MWRRKTGESAPESERELKMVCFQHWSWRKGVKRQEMRQLPEDGRSQETDPPEPPEGMQPWLHLDLTQWDPFQTSDLWNPKMINSFCFLFVLLFIYFILAAPCLSCGTWDLCCGMQDLFVETCGLLSCGMHEGSSSLTRDRTRAPCIGSTESYPLDHQGSPSFCFKPLGFW